MDTIGAIIRTINTSNGHCFIVGGFVRDQVMGRINKDVDVEVFGMSVNQVAEVCSRFGTTDMVGQRFGVVSVHGCEAQFSVPRRDNRMGVGHQAFSMEFDPDMTIREAAERRDFTMNSMSIDTMTGEIVDPFGGRDDIEAGVIRHTSEHFSEDAVRVMRAVQFASRFGFRISTVTAEVCRAMTSECASIHPNPMWAEWAKFAQGGQPGAGMQVMFDTGWAWCWPEVGGMIGVAQDAAWHPEGGVWEHTRQVVDAAARICDRDGISGDERIVVVMAAFCHDMGKATTSAIDAGGRIISHGHDAASAIMAQSFMQSIGAPQQITAQVVAIVGEHMFHIFNGNRSQRPVGRFIMRISASGTNVAQWARVVEADHSGRGSMPAGMPAEASEVVAMAAQIGAVQSPPQPIVMGRHMIAIGFQPGPAMGAIIRSAFEAQMAGEFNDVDSGMAWVQAHAMS